jgi:hypothetical protein
MGTLSDKLLWSAGPATTRAGGGFDGFSSADPNRPSAQTSTGKIANSTSLLDSGWAQLGATLAGAAVPGLGLGLNAVNAAQLHAIENAQRAKLGPTFGEGLDLEPMGFAEALARAFSPKHDISMSKEAFDKQMATRQKSADINAEAVAGASGASGRDDGLRESPQVADLTSTTKSRKQAFMGRPEALSSASFNFGAAPGGLSRQGRGGGYGGRSGSGVGGAGAKGGGGFGGRPGRSGANVGGPDRNGPAGRL